MKRKTDFKSMALLIASVLAIIAVCSFLIGGTRTKEDTKKPDVEIPEVSVGSELPPTNGYISFLGDSITTYEGWSNNADYNSTIGNNGVYYNSSKMDVTDTWWYQVAKEAGYGLCVNNSWDGARVTDTKEGIPSGLERASQLHNDNLGITPDVIIVYLGTNDIANEIDDDTVKNEFLNMMADIVTNYPDAKIYACGVLPESRNVDDMGSLEYFNLKASEFAGTSDLLDYTFIDLNSLIPDWDYTTDTFVDGELRVHPTAEGMDKITEAVLSVIQVEG